MWKDNQNEADFQKLLDTPVPKTLNSQIRLLSKLYSLQRRMLLDVEVFSDFMTAYQNRNNLTPRARARISRKFAFWIISSLSERNVAPSGNEQPCASIPG